MSQRSTQQPSHHPVPRLQASREQMFKQPNSPLRSQIRLGLAAIAALLPLAIAPAPSPAAEQLTLSYDSIALDVSVADVEALADQNSPVPRSFEPYIPFISPQQLESIQQGLGYRLSPDSVMLSQFLNSPVGERLLHRLGNLVKVDESQRVALLREAFITAAQADTGLTVMNLLRAYPEETLNLDLKLALTLVEENSRIYGQRSAVVKALWDAARTEGYSHDPLPGGLERQQPGPISWQKEEIQFQNPGRDQPSQADLYLPQQLKGDTLAAPASEAIASSLGPTTKQRTDVIVISHGLASDRNTFAYLAEHLASHGFGVIVLEHIETSSERFDRFLRGEEGPPAANELIDRPRDITTVLDYLTQQAQGNPALQQLNLNAVGLLGQSLGGYTVLASAGATINRPLLTQQCDQSLSELPSLNASLLVQCRGPELPPETDFKVQDPRVKAAFAINPLTSAIFGPSGLKKIQVPTLIVASINDFFAPALPEQIEPFSWLETDSKYLLVSSPATHFSFLGSEKKDSVLPLPPGLIGPEPKQTFNLMEGLSLAFFQRHLQGKVEAESYLSQDYVHQIDSGAFEFGLFRELPNSFSQAVKAVEK